MEENWKVRQYLAAAYRALDELGLNEGIHNHLSAVAPARSKNGNVILMLPFGYSWKEATPSKIVGINLDKELVEGEEMPELTALTIHTGVYKARPDVKSVVHTHMTYATALGCLKDPTLRMVHQNATFFWNRVAYDHHYGGLVQGMDEGQRIATLLGQDKYALLLCNHGVLVVGKSVPMAFDLTFHLESACRIQVTAMSTGREMQELPEDVCKRAQKQLWTDMDENRHGVLHLEAYLRWFQKDPEFSKTL